MERRQDLQRLRTLRLLLDLSPVFRAFKSTTPGTEKLWDWGTNETSMRPWCKRGLRACFCSAKQTQALTPRMHRVYISKIVMEKNIYVYILLFCDYGQFSSIDLVLVLTYSGLLVWNYPYHCCSNYVVLYHKFAVSPCKPLYRLCLFFFTLSLLK